MPCRCGLGQGHRQQYVPTVLGSLRLAQAPSLCEGQSCLKTAGDAPARVRGQRRTGPPGAVAHEVTTHTSAGPALRPQRKPPAKTWVTTHPSPGGYILTSRGQGDRGPRASNSSWGPRGRLGSRRALWSQPEVGVGQNSVPAGLHADKSSATMATRLPARQGGGAGCPRLSGSPFTPAPAAPSAGRGPLQALPCTWSRELWLQPGNGGHLPGEGEVASRYPAEISRGSPPGSSAWRRA